MTSLSSAANPSPPKAAIASSISIAANKALIRMIESWDKGPGRRCNDTTDVTGNASG